MNERNAPNRRRARKGETPNREIDDRGGVLITATLCLTVLMGIAALAIDGGGVYNERRTTQNAADNTALAAAWAHCMGVADPIAHALVVAEDNGYDSSEVEVEQDPGGDFESQYRAQVTSINDTTFARIIGTDEVTVMSEATAACVRSEGGGAFAMFAKGPECQLNKGGTGDVTGNVYSAGNMTWNGGGSQTVGDVHTDANLIWNGPANIGSASVFGTADSNPYNPSIIEGAPKKNLDYPVDFEIDDFRPDTPIALAAGDQYHHYTGNVRASDININGQGIHFVEGNVVSTGQPLTASPITIVATGTINLNLNNTPLTAYHEGLAMMAGAFNPPCNDVLFLGGQSKIAGLLFAPNGGLWVQGGTVNGAMIAWSIATGGSLELEVDVSLFPGGLPQVFLLS